MPGGRPTLYRPEYCEALVAHMREGLSYESFAGKIGVSRETLYAWEKAHDEFRDAKTVGEAASLRWWEALGRDGARGVGQEMLLKRRIVSPDGTVEEVWEASGFNASAWIFTMKNRFGWRDVSAVDASVKVDVGDVILSAVGEALGRGGGT